MRSDRRLPPGRERLIWLVLNLAIWAVAIALVLAAFKGAL